jgi:hypothetical protein
MAIEYKWTIFKLETKKEGSNTDSVVTVHWSRVGVEGTGGEEGEEGDTVRATRIGSTNFTSIGKDSFVPFADLTHDTVLGWVKAEVDESVLDTAIAADIAEKDNPKVSKELPWR